ncbi:TPA: immunity protein Tsi6 family protein, partial [Serratia odorifera]
MTAIDYVNAALAVVKERQNTLPSFPLYQSALNQIQYIKDILEGNNNDKSKLHTIT